MVMAKGEEEKVCLRRGGRKRRYEKMGEGGADRQKYFFLLFHFSMGDGCARPDIHNVGHVTQCECSIQNIVTCLTQLRTVTSS